MKKLACLAAIVCVLVVSPAHGQDPGKRLTNQDVIAMVKLGLSDDVIIAKIRAAGSRERTGTRLIPASTD